jgi:hypothetical protein
MLLFTPAAITLSDSNLQRIFRLCGERFVSQAVYLTIAAAFHVPEGFGPTGREILVPLSGYLCVQF